MSDNPIALVDANVFLRHLLQDEPNHSSRASALFEAVEFEERRVHVADVAICEVVFVLSKRYKSERVDVRDAMVPLIGLPSVVLPGKRMMIEAFDLWVREAGLSFVDCYQLCLARQLGLSGVITFDKKMSRLPGVERIEP